MTAMTAVKALKTWLPVVAIGAACLAGWTPTVAVAHAAGQANVTPAPEVPSGAIDLGSVVIPRRVLANGESLPAGTYEIRVTAEQAEPAAGATPSYERWVEFVQGGEVKGKDVLSIVPSSEIAGVAESAVPGAGSSKVELLKGNDYLRVWVNRGSVNYLIHLPVA
jgi:hypothetical protein